MIDFFGHRLTRMLPIACMSGAQRLSIVGIEIAETRKRRPNWMQIAIGASVAVLAHAAFFFFLAGFQKYEPRFIGHSITTSPALDDEMSWVESEFGMVTKHISFPSVPVVIESWPIQPSAANLASLKFIDPEDKEDELFLMGWFGLSMEF